MTGRVVDCRAKPIKSLVHHAPMLAHGSRPRGFVPTLLAALLLVPVAGAAEPPHGWTVATLTAATILVLVRVADSRAHWGWLALLTGVAATVTPRGQLTAIGPGLFVATGLFLVLWFANRDSGDGGRDRRSRYGARERQAQLRMGMSGERHVADVLARELPQEFVLINGLTLPRAAGDIDHLVVGPTGVFLLETKTMAGQIVCEPDGAWHRTRRTRAGTAYPAYIGDPAAQVQRNIYAVRCCLRDRAPDIFRRTGLWVQGLLVFPHPRTQLTTDHSRVPAVKLDEAAPYIRAHTPKRFLQAMDVDEIVDALLVESGERPGRPVIRFAQSAQGMVEVALALPVILTLLFGTLALSRLIQAQTAVVAIAHEAARTGALAQNPADAVERMRHRVDVVAPAMGLDARAVTLDWDVSTFARDRGYVWASVRYPVTFAELPLAAWAPPTAVRAEHIEWLDPFRSGVAQADGP